jgi:hypothetical protein
VPTRVKTVRRLLAVPGEAEHFQPSCLQLVAVAVAEAAVSSEAAVAAVARQVSRAAAVAVAQALPWRPQPT